MKAVAACILLLCTAVSLAQPTTRPAPATRPAGGGRFQLQAVPLKEALEHVRLLTDANFSINWRAIEEAGIAKDTPVSVDVRNVTLRRALALILLSASPERQLTFYVSDGVVEITTQAVADQDLIVRIYPIRDILMQQEDFEQVPFIDIAQQQAPTRGGGGGQNPIQSGGRPDPQRQREDREKQAQQIIDYITAMIRPEIWQVNGGTSTINIFNGNLVVRAPRSVHERIGNPAATIKIGSN